MSMILDIVSQNIFINRDIKWSSQTITDGRIVWLIAQLVVEVGLWNLYGLLDAQTMLLWLWLIH